MSVPENISTMQSLTINRRNYLVVGRAESTRDGFWTVPVVPVDLRPREILVSFAKFGADGTFMGWTQIKRPGFRIDTVFPVKGRDYKFVTDLVLKNDGFWHAIVSAVNPLPGEKDCVGRFRSNGDFVSVTP
jgi:hypothetical protein